MRCLWPKVLKDEALQQLRQVLREKELATAKMRKSLGALLSQPNGIKRLFFGVESLNRHSNHSRFLQKEPSLARAVKKRLQMD